MKDINIVFKNTKRKSLSKMLFSARLKERQELKSLENLENCISWAVFLFRGFKQFFYKCFPVVKYSVTITKIFSWKLEIWDLMEFCRKTRKILHLSETINCPRYLKEAHKKYFCMNILLKKKSTAWKTLLHIFIKFHSWFESKNSYCFFPKW